MATHDVAGRILASLGQGGPVDSRFEPSADVPKAGVLLALPALLASGLWKQTEEHFVLPCGYDQLVHLFLLVAFLALARVQSLESLRYCAPGKWGKVLGLDRIPEVRTLREKWQLQEEEILPRLEKEVPDQPTAQELAADPTLDKFIGVFDREGYSPAGLQRMKERRIGCLTYHKPPGPDWPETEFQICRRRRRSGRRWPLTFRWDKSPKPSAWIGSAAAARTWWTPSSWWRIGPRRR